MNQDSIFARFPQRIRDFLLTPVHDVQLARDIDRLVAHNADEGQLIAWIKRAHRHCLGETLDIGEGPDFYHLPPSVVLIAGCARPVECRFNKNTSDCDIHIQIQLGSFWDQFNYPTFFNSNMNTWRPHGKREFTVMESRVVMRIIQWLVANLKRRAHFRAGLMDVADAA